MQFPNLRARNVSPNIRVAFSRIETYYQRARRLLSVEEPDGVWLKIAADNLRQCCVPLIDAIGRSRSLPKSWVRRLMQCIAEVESQLREGVHELQGINQNTDQYVNVLNFS